MAMVAEEHSRAPEQRAPAPQLVGAALNRGDRARALCIMAAAAGWPAGDGRPSAPTGAGMEELLFGPRAAEELPLFAVARAEAEATRLAVLQAELFTIVKVHLRWLIHQQARRPDSLDATVCELPGAELADAGAADMYEARALLRQMLPHHAVELACPRAGGYTVTLRRRA